MTTPKQHEQTAREAAEARAAHHLVEIVEMLADVDPGSAVYIPKLAEASFLAGYRAGRAKGLELAAGIAEDLHSSLAGGQEIAQAIRAAVAPSQKPPQT